jgi:hypothetical protein
MWRCKHRVSNSAGTLNLTCYPTKGRAPVIWVASAVEWTTVTDPAITPATTEIRSYARLTWRCAESCCQYKHNSVCNGTSSYSLFHISAVQWKRVSNIVSLVDGSVFVVLNWPPASPGLNPTDSDLGQKAHERSAVPAKWGSTSCMSSTSHFGCSNACRGQT